MTELPPHRLELQGFLDHVNSGALIEGGSTAAPVHARRRPGGAAGRRRAQHRLPHTRRGAGPAGRAHRQGGRRVGRALPALLQRVRQEPDPRQGRLHQHRLPLPGHRRHHHRRRHPHRPWQHPDDAEPQRRPRPASRHGAGADRDRPQGVARRGRDRRAGRDHRRRSHRRRRRRRDHATYPPNAIVAGVPAKIIRETGFDASPN